MADALCGPSNALQNFKKHSSVDRSLQQDRLINRHAPSQGFRSSPGPNAGLLDPEFEAFQAGFPAGPSQPDLLHAPARLKHQASQPALHAPPQLPGWATDFQRLQISSPARPSTSHQPQPFAPQVARQPVAPSWHQDFLQQQQNSTPSHLHHAPIQQPGMGMGMGMGMFGMQGPMAFEDNFMHAPMSDVSQGKQRLEEVPAQFDDAAFESAFNDAQAEILAEEELLQEAEDEFVREMNEEGEQLRRLWVGGVESTNHLAAQAQLDTIKDLDQQFRETQQDILDDMNRLEPEYHQAQEEQQKEAVHGPEDADALARTAGQLLDSVSDNTSQKFQESQFLTLMRKLRDREVHVEGDKMIETPTRTSTSISTPVQQPVQEPTQQQGLIPPNEQDTDDGRRMSTESSVGESGM